MTRTSNRSKLRPQAGCLAIVNEIVETAAAHEAACEILRCEITEFVESCAHLPVEWLDGSEQTRRAIAERVVERIMADGHELLKEWRDRVVERRDHAGFWTMVRTVVWYVAIGYARSAQRVPEVTSRVRRRRSR